MLLVVYYLPCWEIEIIVNVLNMTNHDDYMLVHVRVYMKVNET